MEQLLLIQESLLGWWEAYAYLDQKTAAGAQLVLVVVGGVAILMLWLRWLQAIGIPLWVPTFGSTLFVGIFAAMLHLQASFNGSADMRCHTYEYGELKFELIQAPMIVAPQSADPRDDFILLLVVRSPARWGEAMHICGIPAHLPVAKKLLYAFSQLPEDLVASASGGSVSFTFGNGFEEPNVTWDDFSVPPEKGPPGDPGDNI